MSDETQETTCLDFGDECQVASDFYDAGYDAGTKGVTAILNDLLEEVAGCHYSCECINCHWARLAADRAEARLKGINDE